jgi:hypothetical protein|tara:strand:- start:2148 stop:2579 length:432 start_codon:yes stop_codon:yes gene_type:complete
MPKLNASSRKRLADIVRDTLVEARQAHHCRQSNEEEKARKVKKVDPVALKKAADALRAQLNRFNERFDCDYSLHTAKGWRGSHSYDSKEQKAIEAAALKAMGKFAAFPFDTVDYMLKVETAEDTAQVEAMVAEIREWARKVKG